MNQSETRQIELRPISKLDQNTLMQLRDIRNEEGVRKWMYTDHVIATAEHELWAKRAIADNRQRIFCVLDEEDRALGAISVSSIDLQHRKADWAFYLSSTARGGLGTALEYAFINYIFNSMDIEKLNCEVIEGNTPVIGLHKKFLFAEEGFRHSNIVKEGKRIGVYLLGLTREDWLVGLDNLYIANSEKLNRFSISIG